MSMAALPVEIETWCRGGHHRQRRGYLLRASGLDRVAAERRVVRKRTTRDLSAARRPSKASSV